MPESRQLKTHFFSRISHLKPARLISLILCAGLIAAIVLSCTQLPQSGAATATPVADTPAVDTPAPTATATETSAPTHTPAPADTPAAVATTIPTYGYQIVHVYPHDRAAFTQGLVYENGVFYEGTGLWGQSSLRKVEIETGAVLQSHRLDAQYFGEGITIFGEHIYQLTWKSQTGFIYDKSTFQLLDQFEYPTEGWGLTHDGQQLIMSDGTSTLHFLDPVTLEETGQVTVRANGAPVVRLNELEYIAGEVFANIWQTDRVARIDPQSGNVTGWIDLAGLLEPEDLDPPVDVLNGIAYDPDADRLFVTGKLWPKVFEIELVGQKAYIPMIGNGHTGPAQITLLHTNDFHGYLEPDDNGNGGSAHMAGAIQSIRDEVGKENVLLLDAGDVYLGAAPISQLLQGESTIDVYNMLGYDAASYGNHEFDISQEVLISRTTQSDFPWIGANIVIEGTEWDTPAWSPPYVLLEAGDPAHPVTIGVIGLDTPETGAISSLEGTAGLEFRDPTETILHYYDEVRAQSDGMIILAHMGTEDDGSYKGLRTVAQELIDAGKPVDLMIAGHQHVPLFWPARVGDTSIVEAGYHGRWLGRASLTVDPASKSIALDAYQLLTIDDEWPADPEVAARVAYWAGLLGPELDQPIGTTNVSLRRNYNGESNLGNLVADGILRKADEWDDGLVNGSVDIAFTNPGGLRTDIIVPDGATLPHPITWRETFEVMPFGNSLFLMDLTGAQIQTLLDQSAALYKGILQTAGATWSWRNDCRCDSPSTWGAFDVMVAGAPMDDAAVYRVVTNGFLAAGQDGWVTFAEGTNREDTYYDMQTAVNEYIGWYNSTSGPIDYVLEGRIVYAP